MGVRRRSILDISDLKSKNIFRALSRNPTDQDLFSAYNSIRILNSPQQVFEFSEIALSQPIRKHFSHECYFPQNLNQLFNPTMFTPVSLEKEFLYQCAHINHQQKHLVSSFEKIGIINSKIAGGDLSLAFNLVCEFIEEFGVSRTIIKKLAFIHANSTQEDGINSYVTELIEAPAKQGTAAHYFQLYEIFDDGFLIETFRRWYERVAKLDNTRSRHKYLYNLWPNSLTKSVLNSSLNVVGVASIIDCAHQVLSLKFSHNPTNLKELFSTHKNCFSQDLLTAYKECFCDHEGEIIEALKTKEQYTTSRGAYRVASVLQEYSSLHKFKSSIDIPHCVRLTGADIDWENYQTVHLGSSFFPLDLSLKKLGKKSTPQPTNMLCYQYHEADSFLKTTATIEALRRGNKLTSLTDIEVRRLLDGTESLAHLLTFEEITELHNCSKAENQLVIACLTTCLLYQSDPNDERDFDFRMDMQDAVLSWFDGDIIVFLDWLFNRTPMIARVIGEICDLSLMQKLYLLFDDYDKAFEARRSILIWLGDKFDDNSYVELANRLSTDKKIRKIKGAIDDAKIFVDELKFNQWLASEIHEDLRRFSRSADLHAGKKPSSKINQIGDDFGGDFWLFRACQDAFNEFCMSPIYGVASYLSRRIRHGTLDGHLMTPVKRFFNKQEFSSLFDDTRFSNAANIWLNDYTSFVTNLRRDYLHFQSVDRPKGFLSSDLQNSTTSFEHTQKFIAVIKDHLAEGVATEHILRTFPKYCWQCIETDLVKIKLYINQITLSEIVPSIGTSFTMEHAEQQKLTKFRNNLTRLISARHTELIGWFEKPDAISLTVTIRELACVVINGVREFDDTDLFSPEVIFTGTVDDQLHGYVYHILHDCMFILIGNIAKWGNPKGRIVIEAERNTIGSDNLIKISISSEYLNTENKQSDIETINAKMSSTNTIELMTKDRGSGLGKLRKIIEQLPESYSLEYDLTDVVKFSVIIPIVWMQI